MPNFRSEKQRLLKLLAETDWHSQFSALLTDATTANALANPLLAMLPRPDVRWQAILCIGEALSYVAERDRETARNFMRRLMWSLNEESGNLGWGIPESMGAIIAAHAGIAKEFERVLLSYVIETGKSDNFIDFAQIRVGAYWGIGHAAGHRQTPWFEAAPWLVAGLHDEDAACAATSAFALARVFERVQVANVTPDDSLVPLCENALKNIETMTKRGDVSVQIFEAEKIRTLQGFELAERARQAIRAFHG